jgi:hypothetical protein
MSIYLKWQNTVPDSRDRFIANLFSNLAIQWYPSNIQGSNLYDLLSMYATEFASGSTDITQVFNDLFIENARTGVIQGRSTSKLYDNFGVMVGVNKLPYQEYDTFNTGSLLNSYRTELKFLTLSYTESTTIDAVTRIGQAINGISPVIIEPIQNYPGWILSNFSGSVVTTVYNSAAKKFFVMTNPAFGRFGRIIPIQKAIVSSGSVISLSYSILGLNTILKSEEFEKSGVLLYFFIPSGSVEQIQGVKNVITTALDNVLPAYITKEVNYSFDYALWRPVAPAADTMVSGSNIFAVSKYGWIYNAEPTAISGSVFITDVIQIP